MPFEPVSMCLDTKMAPLQSMEESRGEEKEGGCPSCEKRFKNMQQKIVFF